jgi:hypothetical protein
LFRAGEKWVTRDIAALDFLLGVPLAAEPEIVAEGWQRQLQHERELTDDEDHHYLENPVSAKGTWFEHWVQPDHNRKPEPEESAALERPDEQVPPATPTHKNPKPVLAAGRRLEGDEAFRVQIPLTTDTVTRQKSIARQAALREWELHTAHGLSSHPPLMDGRIFFSANSGYPLAVFSMLRYEPSTYNGGYLI